MLLEERSHGIALLKIWMRSDEESHRTAGITACLSLGVRVASGGERPSHLWPGSFAKAAETLGMSQPTASKAIIRLERRLGTTLLYRTSRRISLTPTGRLVMERAKHIVMEFELIEAQTLNVAFMERREVDIPTNAGSAQNPVAGGTARLPVVLFAEAIVSTGHNGEVKIFH